MDARLSFSFLDSRNILAEASAAELLPRSLLGIMRIRRISTMKRRMLSVLLSIMLVIATICVSNMPSRAVEPEDEITQDETTQDEIGTAEVLSNSEVTATGEATVELVEDSAEETTETFVSENFDVMVTEEAVATEETIEGDEKASENVMSAETIAGEENSASQTDATENESGATDFDADTEVARDTEGNEMSEEATEEVAEEINEEMLNGAEIDKLENVQFYFGNATWDSDRKKEYSIHISVRNENEFDVYLSCLRSYVIDEKGNKYNVPVVVETYALGTDKIDITNDINGYSGYNNESVLTDKGVCIPPKTAVEGGPSKYYDLNYTIPAELEGNITFYMYAEAVKLDDISGKVVSLCNDSGNYFMYECETNVENSNYSILRYVRAELGNVDIDVYYDGNYITAGSERNFYIQISNNNDFDIWLSCIMSKWAYENYDSEDEIIKNMQIIHPDGRNMTNLRGLDDAGYSRLFDGIEVGGSVIKAGQTATYRVNCMLSSDSGEKSQTMDFHIDVSSVNNGVYCFYCEFNPLNNDTPAISIDRKDETVPDIKLDDEAYDNIINSIFTKTEINSGKHLKVDLIIAALSEADVEQSELETIKAAARKRKIAVILDMNLVKLIDGIVSGNMHQLDKEITMTIDIPKAFLADNRKFSIIRLHDGIAEELPDLDDNPNTVTFTTGKFSLYTLIYEDVEEGTVELPENDAPDAAITPVIDANKTQQASSPNTGDTVPIAVVFILMLISAFLAVVSVKHIKKNK